MSQLNYFSTYKPAFLSQSHWQWIQGLASADVLAAGRCFADALLVLFSTYIQLQFMCVHVTHALGGAMLRAFSTGRARSYVDVPNSEIAINKLFEWLLSRVLAFYRGGLGSSSGQDMSVLGPPV